MSFYRYVFQSSRDNAAALGIWLFLAFIYMVLNVPFIEYMNANEAVLQRHTPFYHVPFTLNLFNFDPSMYYGYSNVTVIHPLLSLLSGLITSIASHAGSNTFYLALQSIMNSASAVIVFYYLRRSGNSVYIPVLWALWFGVSSYSLFTAMIPDSYAYAQFVILLSLLYLQYCRAQERSGIIWNACFAVASFGITATNVLPFIGAYVIQTFRKPIADWLKRTLLTGSTALILLILLTLIQGWSNNGTSWLSNWNNSLHNGGYSYTAPFSFSAHWKIVYSMLINPVLTPVTSFIDPDIAAFASDLNAPHPWYVSAIGFSLIGLAVLGLLKLWRSREVWMLALYIGLAIYLHIIMGFGLAAFQYDMYLYAGHFLFAFFLLGGRFVIELRSGKLKNGLVIILFVFTIATLFHNNIQHYHVLDLIKQSYSSLAA
ncbi:DUF6080 domain-containing protein [Paenibacillus xylaniclasticus]|uniref:DUF6080 domain-containing protein n=1 Tax=Paenibacillus xylaniclasticus TaxID=588083 RepID=UPI000FDC10AE|nr:MULTISPECIES: DUF6080 domain-containing protein [Paenibacillus]GFN31708.1 hypothetical protein PCURB6_19680 [Paenibacillus curdlanolyticus]